MSRVGKKPIEFSKDVKVKIDGRNVSIEGKSGKVTSLLPELPLVEVKVDDGKITVARKNESKDARREQGLMRALLQNQIVGATEGYRKELDIVGVGYKAEVKGKELHISAGYAYPKIYRIPDGLKVNVEKNVRIFLSSTDKWVVGQAAAQIRKIRPPEPYKGKGIRYYDEQIKRKVGKAAVGSGGK